MARGPGEPAPEAPRLSRGPRLAQGPPPLPTYTFCVRKAQPSNTCACGRTVHRPFAGELLLAEALHRGSGHDSGCKTFHRLSSNLLCAIISKGLGVMERDPHQPKTPHERVSVLGSPLLLVFCRFGFLSGPQSLRGPQRHRWPASRAGALF